MGSRPKPRRPSARASRPHRAPAKRPSPPKKAKPAPKRARAPPPRPAKRPAPASSKSAATPLARPENAAPRADARRHVLSLSFLRDGDEFLARLETDAGQITELKNRSLDQLLTLVASELEDLLE
jgi:3-oxoacyl-ACP reductase-like protein